MHPEKGEEKVGPVMTKEERRKDNKRRCSVKTRHLNPSEKTLQVKGQVTITMTDIKNFICDPVFSLSD